MVNLVRTTISIREDQLEWVQKNNSLNLSGMVRDVLDELMKPVDQDENKRKDKEGDDK